MKTLSVEYRDQVALINLHHGVTNSINLLLIDELSQVLSAVVGNNELQSLVLSSSSDKFFSIGFDIPELYDLPREEFTAFYQVFNQVFLNLYTFPKPVVAAINGHAVAGGTILALCCDYRFIAEGHKLMGLNEIKLGVPVPFLADLILKQIVGARYAQEMAESGEFYPAEKVAEFGLVDEVFPLDLVLPKAIEKASSLSALPEEAYALIKHNRVETVTQRFTQSSKEKEELFVDCWYSPAARERLIIAMEKF
jgi:enoyl-CoA hydratase/carnithine racemase